MTTVVKVTSYSNRNILHKIKPSPNTFSTTNCSRRQTLTLPWIAAMTLVAPRSPALAITERNDSITIKTTLSESTHRPRAPLAALLPAMQQRLLLEQCLYKTTMYLTASTPAEEEFLLSQLKSILPPDTESDTTLAMTNHRFSHQQLHQHQLLQLTGRTIRTTCNTYTEQLTFADTYLLTTDQAIKSRIIRRDGGIPTVQQVVIADLDLRDLYRNEMQTLIDDARAELYSPNRSWKELNSLLTKALQTSDNWLSFIPDDDIMESRQVLLERTGR